MVRLLVYNHMYIVRVWIFVHSTGTHNVGPIPDNVQSSVTAINAQGDMLEFASLRLQQIKLNRLMPIGPKCIKWGPILKQHSVVMSEFLKVLPKIKTKKSSL